MSATSTLDGRWWQWSRGRDRCESQTPARVGVRQRGVCVGGRPIHRGARAARAPAHRAKSRHAARTHRAPHRRAVPHQGDRPGRHQPAMERQRDHARLRDRLGYVAALGAAEPQRRGPAPAGHPAGLRRDVRARRLRDRLPERERLRGRPSPRGRWKRAHGRDARPRGARAGLRRRQRTAVPRGRRRPVHPDGRAVRARLGSRRGRWPAAAVSPGFPCGPRAVVSCSPPRSRA